MRRLRLCLGAVGMSEKCPECDGDGYVEITVPRPHNVNRDVGYLDTEKWTCETCHGSGEAPDEQTR